jgi:hypothetical protein
MRDITLFEKSLKVFKVLVVYFASIIVFVLTFGGFLSLICYLLSSKGFLESFQYIFNSDFLTIITVLFSFTYLIGIFIYYDDKEL